jgi:hypothetical protein
MIPGKAVELGDGLRWLIPRLSAYVGGEGFSFDLPCYADLSDDGRWINGQVIEEYRPAQQIAQRLHDGMIRAELGLAPRLSSEEVLILSAEILQLNYRIGGLECAMLRLLRLTESLRDIAKAAVDWQTFVEWYEKKTAESDHTGRTPAAGRVAAAGRAPAAGQALASAG